MLVKGQKSNKTIPVTQILAWEQNKELAADDKPPTLKSEESSHASAKLSHVGGFALDSLVKSGFPSLHMQDSLAKKWIDIWT